jgi:hypothetical protein
LDPSAAFMSSSTLRVGATSVAAQAAGSSEAATRRNTFAAIFCLSATSVGFGEATAPPVDTQLAGVPRDGF